MRIAFYVIGNRDRSNYLNGVTMRYGGASASGTDTSVVLVAEHLASVGHEVVIACEKTYVGETTRGVTYTNLNFDKIENKTFDVLISMLWVSEYETLPITVTKGFIYWSHMQWIYGVDDFMKYTKTNNLKAAVVHISEWEKKHTDSTVTNAINNYDSEVKQYIIPNPITNDITEEVNNLQLSKKPHKVTFHASWARGGVVVYDAVNRLPWDDKELHIFNYLIDININWGREGEPLQEEPFFKKHGGGDKLTIFKHLAESEYFIYPLYTPYQDVHKDTFSCVVAEAIALGTIVLTYPLGAVPEYFGDYCFWVDVPEGFDVEKMQEEALTKDLERKFTNTDNIIKKINYLEENPHLKEEIRERGKQYILETFSTARIGKMWENTLADMGLY